MGFLYHSIKNYIMMFYSNLILCGENIIEIIVSINIFRDFCSWDFFVCSLAVLRTSPGTGWRIKHIDCAMIKSSLPQIYSRKG